MRDLQLPRCPPRTPACPGPRAAPHPLSSHPERGARSSAGPPGARPPQTCSGAAGAPRGLHARLGPRRLGDWGPAGSGRWASYLPQRGATRGRGRSGPAAGRLGPPALPALLGSARAGLTPSRPPRLSRPRPRPAPPPPPRLRSLSSLSPPSGSQPPSRPPERHWGGCAAPPPAAARLGGPPRRLKVGAIALAPMDPRSTDGRARAPRPPAPRPLPPPARRPPSRAAAWERARSVAERRAGKDRLRGPGGGRAASARGGGGRDPALLSGLDFSVSTRILPRLSRPIRCCSATT